MNTGSSREWTWFKGKDEETQYLIITLQIIALVILSTLFMHQYTSDGEKEATPTIGAVATMCSFAIHIEKVDPGNVPVQLINYVLLDDRGEPVPGVDGNLIDLYGLNFDLPGTLISFQDNDRDVHISAGDVLLIKWSREGGAADHGYRLLFTYVPTGKSMSGGGTRLG